MGQVIDLSGFDKSSKQDWEATVRQELNIQHPIENLRWSHDPSIDIDPIYFSSDVDSLNELNSPVQENPEVVNFAKVEIGKPSETLTFCEKISPFCDAFILDFSKIQKIHDSEIIKLILSGKPIVHFTGLCYQTINDLLPIIKNIKVSGSLRIDPIGTSDNIDDEMIYNLIDQSELSNFSLMTIRGDELIRSGASIVQEIGTVFSIMVDNINRLTDKGCHVNTLLSKTEVATVTGQDFFHEVAKIRSYRILAGAIGMEFGKDSHYMRINTTTSLQNASDSDEENNIIRNTIASMAAITGGVDTINVKPHLSINPTLDSHRTALNIPNLLKEESYFNKVRNPSEGSYYLERLTQMMSAAAWKFFQEIESQGGFIQARNSQWLEKQFDSHKKWLKRVNEK
ncbi:MAG: methylmalonyl-CoA mutase family protein [Bacteroidetes bacterium]|nr:methylmalonyl-CoA mutase family protein [Bacteroidota bacterium]MDA1119198.1 methylmalonyl-CoA mutase family protein [Bacteroidota bacterium]